jgi:hypothetical protein
LPAQAHSRPGLELLHEPGLVEPDGDDLAALVADPRIDDRQVSSRAAHRDRTHLAGDRGLLLGQQVAIRRSGTAAS